MENVSYKIEIVRSKRRTMALEITATGRVVVRAPWEIPQWRIDEFTKDKAAWIEHHLKKRKEDEEVLREQGIFAEDDIQEMSRLAKKIIPEKVAYYSRVMGVPYGRISIRKQKSRWGSCSREGNLSFNCLLVMTPPEVLDYVVVHELSHRLEMNHSQRFWREVGRILPDYNKARMWLKENGNQLMLRMHGCDE